MQLERVLWCFSRALARSLIAHFNQNHSHTSIPFQLFIMHYTAAIERAIDVNLAFALYVYCLLHVPAERAAIYK